ncbi:3-dehydro-L-gulonate 2-dehydrogenase [Qiania dongpingensis]|uniref:3-dehydro-L-gulonate 2-dehydrogenase n=1 Tax=Qiania dongpingensis TaxID=2763669 RepID=A0A7G9G228_9FIRM|nr:3-dehydro-L-gulonate 2-dehydrogenase [Qiania dongpingensis]QNM04860.1 3-dehydro-L-gulonate 2-dehydrogenase [Qiania dongpingensis]
MLKISFQELVDTFERILLSRKVDPELAHLAALNFAETSADGVYSHGVNRFPRVIEYLDKGVVDGKATPECVSAFGGFERWDGHMGLGNANARKAMDRACELAKEHGIGIVAIGNTNHWMRGGAYGWQAADNGCIGMCWTNTMPNMPAWGGMEPKVGNNPFIISIPKSDGRHIVVDMAMSQFAYGKIELARMKGEKLPVPGGWDSEGNVTTDPAEIEKTRRVLPIGYWKGSGMSIALDLVAAVLSGRNSVTDIGKKYTEEVGLSQVLIAIDPECMNTKDLTDSIIDTVVEDIKASTPEREGGKIFYPGEIEINTREDHMKNGIPVLEEVWEKIQSL